MMPKRSLESIDLICMNEVFLHPVYGKLQIVFLSRNADNEGLALCKLYNFEGAWREFKTMDLSRLKVRKFMPEVIIGGKK
jgi:hypothetical protein